MKKAALATIGTLLLVSSMVVVAQAQTSGPMTLIANIPFEFNVGDRTLPAGQYIVRQVNPSSDRVVLQFASKRGDSTALTQTNGVRARATEKSVLVFKRYGSQYFFSIAIIDGSPDAWQAPKSRSERGLEKEMADLRAETTTVALVRR